MRIPRRLGQIAGLALASVIALGVLAAPGYAQTDSDEDVVSQVNGDAITRGEFGARVRFVRWQYLNELVKLYEVSGGSLSLAQSYVEDRVASLNDPDALGDAVLAQMEDERLLWQAGEELDRTPTAEDAAEREADFFSLWTDVPAAELPTNEAAQAFITTWYDEATAVSGLTADDLHAIFATEALSDGLFDFIGANVPLEELAVNSRHILCAFNPINPTQIVEPTPEQRASAGRCIAAVQQRLAAGESFASVAAAVSNDASSASAGGELGMVPVSYLAEGYAEAVTGAELNTLIGPVETGYGLHLIEVLERGMQALTEQQVIESQYGYFDAWLASLRDEAEIARGDDWATDLPATPGLDTLPDEVLAAVNEVIGATE